LAARLTGQSQTNRHYKMKRQISLTLVFGLLTFGLGWWLSDMYHFANGVRQDAIRLDSLKLNDSTFGEITTEKLLNVGNTSKTDIIFQDDFDLVVKEADGQVYIWRKFKPKKTFKDFTVSTKFKGQIPKNLNFSTCKYGKLYKTVSRKAADDGANFAGHYAFARMGCGTNCQVSTIIDLSTGNVYAGPVTSCGYDYKLDSKLLIVNPPDSSGLYSPQSPMNCKPEQYLWINNTFKRIE
jgi:hypothetical protein